MQRAFKFNDQELPDPNPDMSTKEVLEFYSNTYPELVSGFVEEPVEEDGKLIYEVKTAVGTKG